MKNLASVLCVLLAAPWALAAPVVTLDKIPSQSNDASSSHVQQTTQLTEPVHQTKSFSLSFFKSPRVSTEKRPIFVVAEDGRRMQLPAHLAGAKSWETPNVLHFLSSLAHPKKLSPFPESSIMREETRANNAEIERQETIVELETKASRESWTYIPYVSQDNVLHFKCVHKTTDTAMFALPFLAVPMLAAAMVLAVLLSALRHTFRSFCSAKDGTIRLDDEEKATPSRSLRVASHPQEPQVARLDLEVDSTNHGTMDEKS
ncbi:hypothetical protein F4781DRAFT_207481 [Annulohypoxylon bovei var. microspora]|nr:hypothetical protein F4781DRAFT_207481 [Annulohypoxylon bovei var. microspora]